MADAGLFHEGLTKRTRLRLTRTMLRPILGHTFAVVESGVRKDTAIVLPGRTLTAEFDADNPGRWMVHCHNVYDAESGMITVLGYLG
jgi:FtsP/CotA-like multicopper oxidase with cupredoxin domain